MFKIMGSQGGKGRLMKCGLVGGVGERGGQEDSKSIYSQEKKKEERILLEGIVCQEDGQHPEPFTVGTL
jgi:hypothetical protein